MLRLLAELIPRQSLSQRSNLVSVISRSLSHVAATTNVNSSSLRTKISAIVAPLCPLQSAVETLGCERTDRLEGSPLAPSIAPQLWLHLQKTTPCRPRNVLQSFVSRGLSSPSCSQTDEMLEDLRQERQIDRESSLLTVGHCSGGASECHRALKDQLATPVRCNWNSQEQDNPALMADLEHSLEEDDDGMLMGTSALSP